MRAIGGRVINGVLLNRATILAAACKIADVSEQEVKSPSRFYNIYRVRVAYIWIARTHLGVSFPQIGRLISRDNSTVRHAFKTVNTHRRLGLRLSITQLIGAVENHFGLPYSFPDARFVKEPFPKRAVNPVGACGLGVASRQPKSN